MAPKRPPVPRPLKPTEHTLEDEYREFHVPVDGGHRSQTSSIVQSYPSIRQGNAATGREPVRKPKDLPRIENFGRPVAEYLDPEDQADSAETLRVPKRQRRKPIDRSWFTGRGIVLTVVVILCFVMLAPSIRLYVEQQIAIGELEQSVSATKEELSARQAELRDWENPEFVKQQARDRLQYVLPGETRYIVVDNGKVPGAEDKTGDGLRSVDSPSAEAHDPTWYEQLWQSVEESGR